MTSYQHAGEGRAPVTVADLLAAQSVADARIHPDGVSVAFVVASNVTNPHAAEADSRVWLATEGMAPIPVTADGTIANLPRWSPDGRTLAFLASRAAGAPRQLHLLDHGWTEARAVTSLAGGVSSFDWSPDSSKLALLVKDPEPDDQEGRAKSGRDEIVYEQRHRFTRLWLYDPAAASLSLVTQDDVHIWEIAWSPSSDELAVIVSDEPYNWCWYGARLARVSTSGGDITTIRRASKQITSPAWSPDGQRIAIISCTWSDHGMTGGDIILIDRDGGAERNLTTGHPRSYLSVEWNEGESSLLCAAVEDGESTIGRLSLDGSFSRLWRAPMSLLRWGGRPFTIDREGNRIAAVRGAADDPADVWTATLTSDQLAWTRLSDMNPTLRQRSIAPTETLHWHSPDGTRVQGLLVRPQNASGSMLPLITLIHGGPTSLWSYDFPAARSMGWVQLLAAAGYAVLLPNPRGSMGWGTAFAEANIGDMGGGDLADILAGVDFCVQAGIADPERLGVGGWSYGGYLTAWAVTQTERFKAAVAGASITNWISFHGVSTIPGFDSTFCEVDPFDWDGYYGQFSPVAHVRRVVTPTLFLHGERDPICPLGQAHEMWRALKELRVDTELVVYPREGHGIREREHARDVLERAVAWFTRYV